MNGISIIQYSGEVECNDDSYIIAEHVIESYLQFKCATCYHYDDEIGFCYKHMEHGKNKYETCASHLLCSEVFARYNKETVRIELFSYAKNHWTVVHDAYRPEQCYRLLGEKKVKWLIDNYDKQTKLIPDFENLYDYYEKRGIVRDFHGVDSKERKK